ncbi:META domain-containing protein [Photobacterium sp.]|uniref:META domain-containing protein n=1 Tax=Photobacterium sp. TaxID=660 RepID=UPI00299D654C|nr:META domain-containing protein [Photobacterium sp.]MDX1302253.1 META domain-containing protein [Photobacterium sp.]
MKKWLLAVIVASFSLLGCDSNPPSGFSAKNIQRSWVLTKVDGKESNITEPRVAPNMTIDSDLKVAGFGGCNRFFGQGEIDGSKFRITAMGSTKMACIQDDQATIESIMTKSLQQWSNAALENDTLTLTSEQHILTFMPGEVAADEL